MAENAKDKIEFQYIMNYKAYRRGMIIFRVGATVLAAGGLACLCIVSWVLGLIFSTMAAFIGVIFILAALGNEYTYNVYSDRIVIKKRGVDKRTTVNIADITSVKFTRAFYEKSLATGTIKLTAKTGGRKKSYRLKHLFDAQPLIDFLNERGQNAND